MLGGREEYTDWFENENPYDQIIGRLYNTSEAFWPTEENLNDVAEGKRVILTNRVFILSKSIHHVFPLPFNVFANPLEMISERGFPLLKRYSNLIMFMRDAGIIDKLYKDFQYNATVLHHIRDREIDELKETQIVLTLGHMDGAFTVLLLGLFISIVTFVLEIIVDMYNRRRRTKRLWKLLRNSWRQVSIMRLVQKNSNKIGGEKRNATMQMKIKWKKSNKKIKFNTSNEAFKPKRW